MNTHRHHPDQPDPQSETGDGPPSIAEIAALTSRLRELTAAGRDADPAARAAFLAEKAALIARITAANTAPTDQPPDHMPDRPDSDATGRTR